MYLIKEKGIVINKDTFDSLNTMVSNSYFENGFFYYPNDIGDISSTYSLSKWKFINNTSYKGTFLHISCVSEFYPMTLNIHNSEFINNTAENFGGVIYSAARKDFTTESLAFSNCKFENNTAILGK